MTNFKKITSAAAAIMIAATMMAGTVAFAEDKTVPTGVEGSNKISVNSTSSNTYVVYQLLEGGIKTVADSDPAEKVFVEPAAGFSLAEGKTVDDILAFADKANISAKTDFSSYYDSTKPVATLEKGIFADIKRPRDGGKGLAGVVVSVAYNSQEKMVRADPVAAGPHGLFAGIFDDVVEFLGDFYFHKDVYLRKNNDFFRFIGNNRANIGNVTFWRKTGC